MKRKEKTVDTMIRCEKREKDGNCYKYELVMRESGRVASYRLPLYSIFVEMKQQDGTVTNAETKEVFADAGRAIIFFDKLVRNLATPIDLAYIVEDELAK